MRKFEKPNLDMKMCVLRFLVMAFYLYEFDEGPDWVCYHQRLNDS